MRIYSGKVESVRQVTVDPLGNLTYEIWFRGNKVCYFRRHQKQMMPIAPGDRINFEGKFIGDKFLITQVIDRLGMDAIEYEFEKKKKLSFDV